MNVASLYQLLTHTLQWFESSSQLNAEGNLKLVLVHLPEQVESTIQTLFNLCLSPVLTFLSWKVAAITPQEQAVCLVSSKV